MKKVIKILINENFKKNSLVIVTSSLLFAMTIFFFGPLEIIMSAPGEFWFSAGDVFLIISTCFCACFFAILLVYWIFSKVGLIPLRILLAAISGIGLAAYIQGNWTFVDYGTMDGQAIDWSNYRTEGIMNTLLWIVIILMIFIVYVFKPKFIRYFSYVFLGIVGVELITLGTLCINAAGSTNTDSFSFSAEGQLELSKNKENIIVILADGFDGSDFLPVLEEEPSFRDCFDGFTFFEDTCGTSYYSQESGITLLTGNQFDVGVTFSENVERAYAESELYDILAENNFKTYLYHPHNEMFSVQVSDKVENFINTKAQISNWTDAFSAIYKMVGFRYTPHVMKSSFWYSTTDFYELKDSTVSSWGNAELYNLIKDNGVTANETRNSVYQFFWIQGPHEPVVIDRYCNPLKSSIQLADESYATGQFEQTIGVVRIFTELINSLKEKGIYDNTTIVFTADHGWDIRQNPLLLIKPAGAQGDLEVSNAPISMIEDYLPTLLCFVTGSKEHGDTVYDIDEAEIRERKFYVYTGSGAEKTYIDLKVDYYSNGAFSGNYTFGTTLYPSELSVHAIKGLGDSEQSFAWTKGKEMELQFAFAAVDNDLCVEMEYATYGDKQNVILYANGQLVEEYVAQGEECKQVRIPKGLIESGTLNLRFELPDAVSPQSRGESEDWRELALMIKKFTIFSHDPESTEKIEYELNTKMTFADEDMAKKYILSGFSAKEIWGRWTDGNRAEMSFDIGTVGTNLELMMEYSTYAEKQQVIVSVNGTVVEDYVAVGAETKSIIIPAEYVKDGKLLLTLELPDAVSPQSRGESEDARELALAMKTLKISAVTE